MQTLHAMLAKIPERPRSPHDLLAELLATLSDADLDTLYLAAARAQQTLTQYAWHGFLELEDARRRPPAGPDPDIITQEYR